METGQNSESKESPSPARQRLLRFLWRVKLSFYALVFAVAVPPISGLEEPKVLAILAWVIAVLSIFAVFKIEKVQGSLDSLAENLAFRRIEGVFGAVLFILVIVELGLAVVTIFVDSPLLRRDQLSAAARVRVQKLKPGSTFHSFPINADGFYDEELPAQEKTANSLRVAAIGDSFSVGIVPKQQNYLSLIEQSAVAAGAKGLELVNLGVCGVGPIEYDWIFHNYKKRVSPDIVVLSIFIGNDLYISAPKASRLKKSGYYLYVLGNRLYRVFTASKKGQALLDTKSMESAIGQFSDEAYLDLTRRKAIVFKKTLNKRRQRRIDKALSVLSRLIENINSPVLVVIIPDELQVNKALQSKIFGTKSGQLKLEDYDLNKPNQTIAKMVSGHKNAVLVDTTAELVAANQSALTYEPNDTHWNKYGNAVAAKVIAPVFNKLVNAQK